MAYLIASDLPKWVSLLANLILPGLGIAIILFCIASFVFPFGQRFKEGKQVIRGFGLDLEISVLTLLLLIGFVMTFSGFYMYLRNENADTLREEIRELRGKLDAAREEVQRAGRFTITANLVLPESVDVSSLDVGKLECRYTLFANPDSWVQAAVSQGLGGNSVRITFADIERRDVIQRLELREHGTESVLGVVMNIYPLQPLYKLEKAH